MLVARLTEQQRRLWDDYVRKHPNGTLYHLSGWQTITEKTYGHKTYYLMAIEDKPKSADCSHIQEKTHERSATSYQQDANSVVGILPLVHIKHFLFGNNLISMPFFDYGGILADDQSTEKSLLSHVTSLARKLGIGAVELRQIEPLSWLNSTSTSTNQVTPPSCALNSHKVRMVLPLPGSSETLMNSFPSKLRSQIRKPIKEGCTTAVGYVELLGDFYEVFSTNMRDLGSPVHSKKLIENTLNEFPHEARICAVFRDKQVLAASVIIGFRDTLENPWASSLRKFRRLSPNMLLYWTMLEYACNNGYRYFDFGRSSVDDGTQRFKRQWGGQQTVLHWHYISPNGESIDGAGPEESKFENAIKFWQRLPVPLTTIIGPRIRKYIGL